MIVSACPIAVVKAPAAVVWATLVDVQHIGEWADARLVSADPPGPAAPGQRLALTTREIGLSFALSMEILEVDEAAGRMRLDVRLPFGVVNHETITIKAVHAGSTRVSFG